MRRDIMNVISFCLYGSNLKYLHGIIESVISYKLFFYDDDWEIRVYVCDSLKTHKVVSILKSLNCIVVLRKQTSTKVDSNEPMYWRFEPMFEPGIEYFFSRDADSRCSLRESRMMLDFIKSKKTLHSILDCGPHHGIMGGTFGIRVEYLKSYSISHYNDFIDPIIKVESMSRRGSDQTWLRIALKSVVDARDVFIHFNEDIIVRNKQRGIVFEDIKFMNDVKVVECLHSITEHTSNFVGRQINVNHVAQDLKNRSQVFLPIV